MENIQTNKERMEQSSTQSYADTNGKENYPLLTRHQIENTPFWVVGSDEIGYKITWGKYTFNDEPLTTKDAAQYWFDTNQWEITIHMIAIGIQASKDEKLK